MEFLPLDQTSYNKDLKINPMQQDPSTSLHGHPKFVYIDLETTGFGKKAEICQIAAKCNEATFSEYILPHNGIHPIAAGVNRLKFVENVLYKDGIPVHTLSLTQCFREFMDFIKSVGGNIILVGHNLLRFDCDYILRAVFSCNFKDQFIANVHGLLDTIPLLKSLLPNRKSYKLTELAKDLLKDDCAEAHDAMYDVQLLERVIEVLNVKSETLLKNSEPLNVYLDKKAADEKIKTDAMSFSPCKKVLSTFMINKLAKANLNLSLLVGIYCNAGEEGIQLLMSEDVDGKPRITKEKRIISGLLNFLKSYSE